MVEMMAIESVKRDKCLRVVGRENEVDSELVALAVLAVWLSPISPLANPEGLHQLM